MFKDGRFAIAAGKVGEPINLPWDSKPCLPQTATGRRSDQLTGPQ
jgi:hypothetical protein